MFILRDELISAVFPLVPLKKQLSHPLKTLALETRNFLTTNGILQINCRFVA